MRNLRKNRQALTAVITTLILLVAAIVLSVSLTYYATNVSSSRGQEEALTISKAHVWVNSTGSVGALMVRNTGSKDVVLDNIEVRGTSVPFADVYLWRATVIVTDDLEVTNAVMNTTASSVNITVQGASRLFDQANSQIPLPSGETVVLYLDSPQISIIDIGQTTTISVHTTGATYNSAVNVKSATQITS